MNRLHNWLIVLLVAVGVFVGGMSLYMASLTGVMNKMGLVGGDFRQAVDDNTLARQLLTHQSGVSCSLWAVGKSVPAYLLSRGEARVRRGLVLGNERIVCGIRLVQAGNIERGVYTMIKGLYYLNNAYDEMRGLVRQDSTTCRLLDDPSYDAWIQAYLFSTEGRIHDVVLNMYNQVQMERAGVLELCTN